MKKVMQKSFGLVRDSNGNPRIDGDPTKLHPAIIMQLTKKERKDIGVWEEEFALDAQGVKRVRKSGIGYEAMDNIVALSVIFDGNQTYKADERRDYNIGAIITIDKEGK
jgi:hypothetical protein